MDERLKVLESTHTSDNNLNIDPIKDLIKKFPIDTIQGLQAFDNGIISILNGQEIFVRCLTKFFFFINNILI